MSTDLIKMIQSNLATMQGGVDEDTRAVAGAGGGNSFNKRVSIKGGVFRKFVGGKEIGAIEDRFMNVIFVKMSHDAARTFYSQTYKEGEKAAPTCWSSDSKTPDPEVKSPFAKACAQCSNSIKGSGQGGGAACRLQWRTAVVLPDSMGGDVMQLVLPATSVFGKEENGKWPFRAYIQMLANHNVSASRVITRMQFDTKSPVPKLLFSPVDSVAADDIETLQQQAKSAAAEAAIKLTVFQTDEGDAPAKPIGDTPIAGMTTQEAAAVNEEIVEEKPKLRESKKNEAPTAAPDAVSVIDKWKKKK